MKHFNIGGLLLLLCLGMSSCALTSYQYCDAYNGVDFEQVESPEAQEGCQE